MKETNEWHLVRLAEYCDGPPTTWQKLQWLYAQLALAAEAEKTRGNFQQWVSDRLTGNLKSNPPWSLTRIDFSSFPSKAELGNDDWALTSKEFCRWLAEATQLPVDRISPYMKCYGEVVEYSAFWDAHVAIQSIWFPVLLGPYELSEFDTWPESMPLVTQVSALYSFFRDQVPVSTVAGSSIRFLEDPDPWTYHATYDSTYSILTDLARVKGIELAIEETWSIFCQLIPQHITCFCQGHFPPLPYDLRLPVRHNTNISNIEERPKHVQEAVKSYIEACKAKPELWDSSRRDVYEWLKTHEKKPKQSLETWQRYVREGSEHIEEAKRRYRSRNRGGVPKPPHSDNVV